MYLQVPPQTAAPEMYSYRVKILNPQYRKDSVVREMRRYHGKFSSVVELKVKILEEFEELVPTNITFAVGYFDGRQSTKRWICSPGDLNAMYDSHASNPGKEIRLWCNGRRAHEDEDDSDDDADDDTNSCPTKRKRRRKSSDTSKHSKQKQRSEPTRREEKESQVDDLVQELREITVTSMTSVTLSIACGHA